MAVLGGSSGEAIGFLHYLCLINHRHYGPVTIGGVFTIDNKNAFYLLASYNSHMGSPPSTPAVSETIASVVKLAWLKLPVALCALTEH